MKIQTLSLIVAASLFSTGAQAATVVDQSNEGSFDAGISFVTVEGSSVRFVTQTFIAGISGSLASIEAALYRATGFESGVEATFYDASLNLLGTTSVPTLPDGPAAYPEFGTPERDNPIYSLFDFTTSNIGINSGETYTVAFRSTALRPSGVGGNFTNALASNGDRYTDGFASVSFTSVNPNPESFGGTLDLLFRSNVSTQMGAVPEPSTWALMLLGMAGIGGAMRRRKTKVAVSYA